MLDTFLFALDAILPIILLIVLGWVLKKIKLFSPEFLNKANKLCFKVLLPVLLFHNTYSINNLSDINWMFILYAVLFSVVAVFGLGIVAVTLLEKDNTKRGVLLQCAVRSNYAIIGIPLATQLFGAEGAAAASLLSAFTIPTFNILAVVALSMFQPRMLGELNQEGQQTVQTPVKKNSVLSVLKDIVTNPLILGVFCGIVMLAVRMLFEHLGWTFRLYNIQWLKTSVSYVAGVTTPLSLMVLGGGFEFSAVKRQLHGIIIGTVARCVVVPVVGLTVACLLFPNFTGGQFASYIALFCTPVAVSSAILAKEMGNDGELAGQLVVWTTVFSSVAIFVAIVVLRSLGFLV